MIRKKYWISILLIILTNILPLFGAILFNYNLLEILSIYWYEAIIIGFFCILKLLIGPKPILSGIIIALFFILHFGLFMISFAMLIDSLLGTFFEYSNTIINNVMNIDKYLLSALFINNLILFIYNYIIKGEYKLYRKINLSKKNSESIKFIGDLTLTLYKRVLVLSSFVLFYTFLMMPFSNNGIFPLIALVLSTIYVDIVYYIKSQDKTMHKNEEDY